MKQKKQNNALMNNQKNKSNNKMKCLIQNRKIKNKFQSLKLHWMIHQKIFITKDWGKRKKLKN